MGHAATWTGLAFISLSLAGCRQPAPTGTPATATVAPPTSPAAAPRVPARQTAPEGQPAHIVHYSIDARIEPTDRHWLEATARLEWEVVRKVDRVRLELRPDLKITRATVGGSAPVECRREQDGAVRLSLPAPVEAGGELTTTFTYAGEIYGPKGGANEQRLWDCIGPQGTYVRFEAGWYPRIAGDSATAEITLHLPEGWTAVSNGKRLSQEGGACHYRTDWPATGLSFTAGQYERIADNAGPVPVECFAFGKHTGGGCQLMVICREVLGVYGELYGPYPFPGFALAEIPNSYGGGHGDQGFIMLYEDAFATPTDEEFVAHEIAHNWWGSLLWCTESEFLIEGFANYSQALYLEKTDGPEAFRKAMQEQAESVLFASLGERKLPTTFEADSGPLLYEKGAWILHMLRRMVGDDVWFATVRQFVDDNAGRVVTCKQFQEAFEKATGENLEWFFRQWLYGTEIPWVRARVEPLGGGRARLKLTQDRVKGEGTAASADPQRVWDAEPGNMRLLVDLDVICRGQTVRESVWMDGPTKEVEIKVPGAPTDVVVDPDVWLLGHHRGLVGELDEDMRKLNEELQKELGDLGKGVP